jgi:hypothetical protein
VPRTAGWTILAKEALELSALALASWAMDAAPVPAAETAAANPRAETVSAPQAPAPHVSTDPLAFVKENAGENARLYRARDDQGTMYAGFYADGRVRVADGNHCFAGMVQNGHAHLLQIDGEEWSELFVRAAPSGALQLELRDGPYDGRVLTCEPVSQGDTLT